MSAQATDADIAPTRKSSDTRVAKRAPRESSKERLKKKDFEKKMEQLDDDLVKLQLWVTQEGL